MVSNNKKNLMEILQIKQEFLNEDLKRTTNLIKQIQKSDSTVEVKRRKDNLSNRINSLGMVIGKLSKTKKILILYHNKNICKMLEDFLKKKGHDCLCALDGRNGLSLIEKERFDVVVLGLTMPNVSGYDIIATLEKSGKLKENKIIIFSATLLSQSEIKNLLKRGVYSYLVMPVKLDILYRTIETI